MYHWVDGFNTQTGEMHTKGIYDIKEFEPETAVNYCIESEEIRESGFYFVCAPDGGSGNIRIMYVNLTHPPDVRVVQRDDIFLGLSHD